MNIKDTTKILTGKTLDKYNRGIGLAPLSIMNKDQDKILEGIYSQQGNQSITEQSNVIHLENSGDGAVELVSVEGNSLVNLCSTNYIIDTSGNWASISDKVVTFDNPTGSGNVRFDIKDRLKPNTKYTVIMEVLQVFDSSDIRSDLFPDNYAELSALTKVGVTKKVFTTPNDISTLTHFRYYVGNSRSGIAKMKFPIILEGDWTNKETPPYFEGLQSSFEEKKVDDKYEIEILLRNKNLCIGNMFKGKQDIVCQKVLIEPSTTYSFEVYDFGVGGGAIYLNDIPDEFEHIMTVVNWGDNNRKFTTPSNIKCGEYYLVFWKSGLHNNLTPNSRMQLEYGDNRTSYVPQQSNKIKVSINEPLRGLPHGVKDRLCIVDGKLVVERKCGNVVLDGSESGWSIPSTDDTKLSIQCINGSILTDITTTLNNNNKPTTVSDKIPSTANSYIGSGNMIKNVFGLAQRNNGNKGIFLGLPKSILSTVNLTGVKQWLQANPTTVLYELEEPLYEEVLNEYGEPVLMEGYENGTVYIDSVIVPTTTVKYELNVGAYREVKKLSSDNIDALKSISNDILPKMMDLDFEILMKEMETSTTFTMGREIDMATMQERTYEMLKRLIIGKSLPEQEVKERVVIYLEAGRINEEQAVNLQLLIAETYR